MRAIRGVAGAHVSPSERTESSPARQIRAKRFPVLTYAPSTLRYFAKRAEWSIGSAERRRSALSGARGALRPTARNSNGGNPRRGHLAHPGRSA
jgi:hypothetical protein